MHIYHPHPYGMAIFLSTDSSAVVYLWNKPRNRFASLRWLCGHHHSPVEENRAN